MFFLDSSGFFSLVGLLVQCALAWTLAVLFAVVLRPGLGPLGSRDWFWAFLSLAVALLAMSLRFVFAYQHVTRSVELVNENAPLTRGLYLIYQLGKAAFIGFLATGVARLRGLRLPAGTPALALGVGVYAALGALLARDVEWMLLLQAPIMIGGSLLARQWLLPFHRERRDVGSWVVLQALPVCATLWGLYAVAVVALDLVADPEHSLWNLPLQFNSYCDLIGQVVVGVGLIVIVLQESQHQTELAHQERDQLREQLARDEKLRALGTLVSGVAHELNNPLTSILGFSDYLLAQDPALRANAARIVREQSERCLGIVRSLSALAGRNPVRREPLVVAEWIDRVVRGFQPQLDAAGVTLEVRCATDLPLVQGDRVGLEQVLANLVANALHASPRGGSIVVRAVHADGRVEVAVLDSGAGIAPEVRSRLFEPFFTTKAPGDGTGLGLALARALVRSHRGELLLAESRPGSGAEFVVQLPIADLHLTVSRETPLPERAGAGGGRELLVIDDEPLVRELVEIRAQQQGWRVTLAGAGDEALKVLGQGGERFAAVVCDLRMPGLSGIQLHDELLRRGSAMLRRFVFITGDLSSPESAAFAARSRCPLVEKPFDIDRLMREIERVSTRPLRAPAGN